MPADDSDVSYQEILYDVQDPLATITLHRPDRLNAWTDRMGAEVKHAMARAEADPRAVAIVLTGAGRGFCAGADLQGLQSLSRGGRGRDALDDLAAEPGDPDMDESFRGTYTYLLSIRKPVIAAINGPCAGMAVPISLCCDLRWASDRAVFTTAFSQRGLIAEWGSSWLLPRLVGPAHAMDLLFSARRIDAAEAERIGLVNRTLPHDELMPHVHAWVKEVAARCSPKSLMVMKRQIWEDLTETLGRAEKKAYGLMLETFNRPDFREGVDAFLEKRPPRFERV